MEVAIRALHDTEDAIDERAYANGGVPVPQGPGLGVDYDRDLSTRYRTGLAPYP